MTRNDKHLLAAVAAALALFWICFIATCLRLLGVDTWPW